MILEVQKPAGMVKKLLSLNTFLIVAILFFAYKLLRGLFYLPFNYINDANKKQRYIDWIKPHAKKVEMSKGINWKFIVAQTALETGWGASSLASKYNNFGGIKAQPGEPFVRMLTTEYDGIKQFANFKTYSTVEKGLKAHANFFFENPRYSEALKVKNDPYKFLKEIYNAGYATSPNYINNVGNIIKMLK